MRATSRVPPVPVEVTDHAQVLDFMASSSVSWAWVNTIFSVSVPRSGTTWPLASPTSSLTHSKR